MREASARTLCLEPGRRHCSVLALTACGAGAQYPSIVKHHDMMANVTGIHAYLARGERRDEFTTSFALKDDSPLPTSVSMPSPVSAEA